MKKEWANKTGFNIMIVHFILVKKLDITDTIYDFSVWLRTDSNSADINRFRSHDKSYPRKDLYY